MWMVSTNWKWSIKTMQSAGPFGGWLIWLKFKSSSSVGQPTNGLRYSHPALLNPWLKNPIGPFNHLRSFGHQGALYYELYYVFLASDPLKMSREYAVLTLRTHGPIVCTRETLHQTQRVSAFLFWLRQMIALLHTSQGKFAARTKFHNVWWKPKGLVRMVTSKIFCKRQKWGRSRPICIHTFALLSFKSCIVWLKYSITINKIWA